MRSVVIGMRVGSRQLSAALVKVEPKSCLGKKSRICVKFKKELLCDFAVGCSAWRYFHFYWARCRLVSTAQPLHRPTEVSAHLFTFKVYPPLRRLQIVRHQMQYPLLHRASTHHINTRTVNQNRSHLIPLQPTRLILRAALA